MKKTKFLSLLILILLSNNAYAKQQLYKIELVIFSQAMLNTEEFDQTESKIAWPKRVFNLSSLKNVNSENMSLRGIYTKLARGENYRPLMHVGWYQSAAKNSKSDAVKISNPEGTINGFFRVQRGHLVYMLTDIEYSPESAIYRIKEKRRFKLNEIHYLDHPKFGILVRISPLK
jgi:hypothetical protein